MRSLHSGSSRVLMPILLVAIAGTVQAQSEPTLAALRSGERPLVVGGVVEFGIFNFVGRDGQPSGMDRDIIRAAAKRLGIKQVDFKTMKFSELGPSLADHKIDVIANNYWPTPEREKLYAFTIPYYTRGGVGALWLEGTGPFKTAASMAGKRVAILEGSYPETWAREHIPTATILPICCTYVVLDSILPAGKADVIVGFYTRQRGVVLNQTGGRKYQNALLQPMRATFGVRKASKELRESLDTVLKQMWDDGSLNQIKRVYLDSLEIEPAKSPQ
jgi:ABC-type amino acid transport substrate-binding protein